jgi:phosphatidylethanolamine/phosphatidyl-N-methylethanolamine N-methyltransferase
MYDLLFDKIFLPGRVAAIPLLGIKPNDLVLEVGIGTGLNLPLYPQDCHLVGIDLSSEMLSKARDKVRDYGMNNVTIKEMDASKLEFPDEHFDHVLATYVISAVPEPVQVLREIKRVCKKKGHIVILNHFKSENPLVGTLEELVAPLCTRLGFKTDLKLMPVLRAAQLIPEQLHRVNLLNGWRLVRCLNE